ncbi:MAG TPA: tetratricopeptide repeat protein [bacterium]|nr:tetratricopeptide repeat protein [bacterium]HPN30321.1 tetratricopeptide repeat protein [bacterium]
MFIISAICAETSDEFAVSNAADTNSTNQISIDDIKYYISHSISRVAFGNWIKEDGTIIMTQSAPYYKGFINFLHSSIDKNISLNETNDGKYDISLRFKIHYSNINDLLPFAAEIFYGGYKYGFDHYINLQTLKPDWKLKPQWREKNVLYQSLKIKEKINSINIEIFDEKQTDKQMLLLIIPNWKKSGFENLTEINLEYFSDLIYVCDYINNITEPVSLKTYLSLLQSNLISANEDFSRRTKDFKPMITTGEQLKKLFDETQLPEKISKLLSEYHNNNLMMIDKLNVINGEKQTLLRQILLQKEQIDLLILEKNNIETKNKNYFDELTNLKKNKDSDVTDYNKKIIALNADKNNALNNMREEFENEKAALEKKSNSEIADLKLKLNESLNENKALVKLIENSSQTVFDLKNRISNLKQEIEYGNVKISSLNNEIVQLKNDNMLELSKQNEKLNKEFGVNLQKQKEDFEEISKGFTVQIKNLNQNIQSLNKEKLNLEIKIDQYNEKLKLAENESSLKSERLKNLMESNEELKKSSLKLQTNSELSESSNKKLQNSIAQLETQKTSLENKLKLETEKNKQLTESLTDSQNKILYFEQIKDLELNRLIDNNKNSVSNYEKKIQTFENEIAEQRKKNSALQKDVDFFKEQLDKKADILLSYENKTKELEKKISSISDTSAKLNKKLKESENEIIFSDKKIKTLISENQSLKKENSSLSDTIQSLSKTILSGKKNISNLTDDITNLKNSLDSANKKIASLIKSSENSDNEKKVLSDRLEKLLAREKEWKQTIAGYDSKIAETEKNKNENDMQLKQLSSKPTAIEKKTDKVKQKEREKSEPDKTKKISKAKPQGIIPAAEANEQDVSKKTEIIQVIAKIIPENAETTDFFKSSAVTETENGDPNHNIHLANTHNKLGMDYFNLGDSIPAIEQFKKSLSYKPDFYDALFNLGASYYYTGEYENAEIYFSKALNITNNDAALNDFIKLNNKKIETLKIKKSVNAEISGSDYKPVLLSEKEHKAKTKNPASKKNIPQLKKNQNENNIAISKKSVSTKQSKQNRQTIEVQKKTELKNQISDKSQKKTKNFIETVLFSKDDKTVSILFSNPVQTVKNTGKTLKGNNYTYIFEIPNCEVRNKIEIKPGGDILSISASKKSKTSSSSNVFIEANKELNINLENKQNNLELRILTK